MKKMHENENKPILKESFSRLRSTSSRRDGGRERERGHNLDSILVGRDKLSKLKMFKLFGLFQL
jgi:hypothetical protein